MKLHEFKKSKWYREASGPDAEKAIGRNLSGWLGRVNNIGLVAKANELWSYITGGKATGADKALVTGGALVFIGHVPAACP
jgi:hypothetical protein